MVPASAQAQGTFPVWEGVVDTVRVEAGRPDLEEWIRTGTGFAQVVPLGPEVAGSRELGDVLSRTVGVHVHRYGGLGSFSLASVRGSSPGHVQVYLDGVPLASGSDPFVDLSFIAVSHLDRAEIYRGALAPPLGGPPAAATLSLVTSGAFEDEPVVAFGVGSFGTRTLRGRLGYTHGGLGLQVSGQLRASDGDFPYLNRNGTPNNTSDDREVVRENNDFDETAVLAKGAYRFGSGLTLAYTGQWSDRESGVPGTESRQTETVDFQAEKRRDQLSLQWSPTYPERWRSWGRPAFELSGYLGSERDRYDNRHGEAGVGRAHFENQTDRSGVRASVQVPILPVRQVLQLHFAGDEETFSPNDLLREVERFERYRRTRTVSLSDRVRALDGRLTAEAVYRWVRAKDNYGGPIVFGGEAEPSPLRRDRFEAPAYGLRLELGRGFAIRGSRGEFARLPTFAELFGENGLQDGNPALKRENGLQWDAGFTFDADAFDAEVAYFESTVRDKIVLLQNSQRTVKAFNLDRTWTRGVELDLGVGFALGHGHRVRWAGNVVWQEARDVGPSRTYRGKWLPNVPETESYLATTWSHGGWLMRHELSTRTRTFRDRYNSDRRRTDGHTLHDLTLERSFFDGRVRWRAEVRNLGDKQIQDIDGFPLPGRSFLFETIWSP